MNEFNLSPLYISLKTATTATIITFFVGILAARWMMGYRGKGKILIESILIAPLVLPPTVLGFILLLVLGKNGPVGGILSLAGINIIFSWPATVITGSLVAFPLMYKTALSAFEQIDSNILSVARTLGVSEWGVFWRVMLPLAWPGILAGVILSFTRALGEFGATLMLAGNIPGQTQTLPMAIYFAVEAGDMGLAFFWVMIILVICLSVLFFVNYLANKSEFINHNKAVKTYHNPTGYPSNMMSYPWLQVEIEKQLTGFCLQVDLSANQQVLGILGASGSGKSMTLRCVAGLETPSRGKIVLNGRVLFDSTTGINIPSCQRKIGVVFQNYALFPHLTVAENIGFGLHNYSRIERQKIIFQKLEEMRLQGLENRYPHQLSGGQQQRVALARALAIAPAALLLDEPFSALDTYLRHQLEKQLKEILKSYQGVTLFVTHNMEEAYRICQNLLVVSEGKVAASGLKQDILERPPSYTVALLTGCKNLSRSAAVSSHQVKALDWGCTLEVMEPIPDNLAFIGIRAHHLIIRDNLRENISDNSRLNNSFPCWLVESIETPFRMTLYLKLHAPALNFKDYHLQAEVFKEKWNQIKDKPFPWYVQLEPVQLFLMVKD